MPMEHGEVARWLEGYIAAWKSYDREQILALFSDGVHYRYYPYDEPIVGREAVADAWLADRDEPGSYDAAYEPFAVDGASAVATGTSTYTGPDGSVRAVYDNCFVMRFDPDGRCADFIEWFVERPAPAG
jgi:hypothetical protein